MRDADRGDAEMILKLYDLRREPEMRKARKFIMDFDPKSIDDVKAVVAYDHPENAHFRQVTSYWGMVADFATRGLLHPEMFAAHCGEAIWIWVKFEPLLPQIRAEINPMFMTLIEGAIKSHPAIQQKADQIRAMRARMAAAAPAKKKAPKKGR
jgi:hypothetical protein